MHYIFWLLICVIFALLVTRIFNGDSSIKIKILARDGGNVERGNFSYFYIQHHGPIILKLKSLSGDADMYISDTNMLPTFEPDVYALHSATCGDDIIEVPENFEMPLAVGVYGYADSSDFLLEVYGNPEIAYPYRKWVGIERELDSFKETDKGSKNEAVMNKKSINTQTFKKKKKNKSGGTSIPSIFSVLEILQLVFL